MTELLAPAGNMEALRAAIANGCDAVYLGMQQFGARAYSCNFDEETLPEAVRYAHLRAVKVYVTMNTIVFEEDGTLAFETNAADDDLLYDEISSGLLIAEIKRNRQELLESLTLYYRVFILGEDVSALLEEED